MPRVIVHLDADAFFAAVEQAGDPKLGGKAIAVGGERRGIIASASYEARKFGVYTPMPTVRARKLCPKLIVLPGDFERYEQFSNWMFGYCYDFTPDVEQTSIDEGYFDLTANRKKSPADIALTIRHAIWELVAGFNGYAFCKAHSTAYGVEAYQAAWLKRYYPAEFMAGVLTNGKGFYHPLVYVLECHRLGLKLLPPSVNEPGLVFVPHGKSIRVPLTHVKGLTTRTSDAMLATRERGSFDSMANFFHRVAPNGEELEAMIRVGAFDEFGETRTRQFWQAQHLLKTYGASVQSTQGWLVPPPGLGQLPAIPLNEPARRERLEAENELFGFAVSGHPLELFDDIAWHTYCPVNRLGEFVGQTVTTCGLVVEQRTHHQVTGEPMKFLSLADWTGIVETELFAPTYRSYGLATVRYPVLEIEARVEPFENGRGYSLRALRAGKPRTNS